ncbi:MAG: hypothetical protein ACYSR0_04980 [Planctomycetota bacterium]|jgi:hypothetical protein
MVHVVTYLLVIIPADGIDVVQQKLFNHFTTARIVVQIYPATLPKDGTILSII